MANGAVHPANPRVVGRYHSIYQDTSRDARRAIYCRTQDSGLGPKRTGLDTPVVATVNDANREFGGVTSMTRRAPDPGNRESLGSGGSMVAKLKLKGIDGRAPPGVEPAA